MNGIEAVARILKLEGVEWIACYPSNPLIEAVAKEGIRPILFRQERGGIMAADAYSRMMNGTKFGVFCMQGGPGSENSMGAVAQAFADNVPILLLPTGLGLDRVGVRPTFSAVRNYQWITKSAEAINRIDQVVPIMRRAFHALRNGRTGPVLVEMTGDVCAQQVPDAAMNYVPPKASLQRPSASDVKDAAKLLLNAKKPLIWAGQGVLYANASKELTALAELTDTPVLTTMPGKSAIDERHQLALGAANRTAPKAVWDWLGSSDVMLAIGSSLTKTQYGIDVPGGKVIIHSVVSPEDINKDVAADIGLPGDARLVLQELIEQVKATLGAKGRGTESKTAPQVKKVKEAWMKEWAPLLTSDAAPINPYRLIHDIDATLDRENSIVTHDAGHPRDQIMPFYTATVPHSYIGWGKTTHLGYGLPLMIGSKLAHPGRFCLNFMGDGAFGMSGLDLETSVRAGAPITTVVLNNGGMGGYDRSLPTALEVFGTSKMTGDYSKIAEGLGAVGIKVTKPAEIVPALKKAQRLNAEGKSALLDVHTAFEMRFSRVEK
ncbi:MAG: thiamine pyrophosphate-requiring protein [SAR202 cluster bacterium]|nr:thiamine pyrophosphate-requiring protein [SAR202 cluster bacterium]